MAQQAESTQRDQYAPQDQYAPRDQSGQQERRRTASGRRHGEHAETDWSCEVKPFPAPGGAPLPGTGETNREQTADRNRTGNRDRKGNRAAEDSMEETTVPAGNGVREDSMAGTTMSAGSSVMGDRMGGGLPGNSMAVRPVAVHTHRGHPVTGGVTDGSLDAPLPGMGEGDGFPDIENDLPNDVIEAPTTMDEVYRGSMKALLLRNIGNYVVATFLIGTQTTVSWEGILYDVGNDYLAIYQSGRDQYIVSDLYSLKYVEFYDTRSRELCDAMLGGEAQENR